MNISHIITPAALCAAIMGATFLSGCSDPKFKVEGTLEGADNEKIVLEKADYSGVWQIVDSTRTDSDGRFSISHIAPDAPEIYRLGAGDQWVYIPVDSTETVTLTAPLSAMATRFTLSGSSGAEQLEKFEKEVHALGSNPDEAKLKEFRRGVYSRYLQDARGSVVSYYILTKTLDGHPLFDASDPDGARYVAAVASSFKEFRPDDPRTAMLENVARNGIRKRRESRGITNVIEADALGFFDMSLHDENGKEVKLSEVAGHGRKTLLVFSLMTHPDSPELNRRLREIATQKNVAIYHISYDPDQYEWHEGAKTLPWTTVYDPEGENSPRLRQYNVSVLPTVFVIDADGQLSTRIEDMATLGSKI